MVGRFSGPDIKSVSKGRGWSWRERGEGLGQEVLTDNLPCMFLSFKISFMKCIRNNMVFDLDPWGKGREVMVAICCTS